LHLLIKHAVTSIMSNQPFELGPSAFIEFDQVKPEPVVEQASKPIDDAMDSDPLSITFGRRKDYKPTAGERMLAGATIDWLIAFPLELRPKALCERFPHVANRIAAEWPNAAQARKSLMALACDARWGSAGYPAQVQAELQRLTKRLAPA
jgi:hypothetical protein